MVNDPSQPRTSSGSRKESEIQDVDLRTDNKITSGLDIGEEETTPKHRKQKLAEVPVINMEDFQKVEVNNKMDLLMVAINKINTNFHHKFEDLKKQLSDEEDSVLPRLQDVEQNYMDLLNRVDALENTNATLMDELEIVKGILQVQDNKIASNAKKTTDLMAHNMSKNVVINGLVKDEKDENCKIKVTEFLRNTMKLTFEDKEVIVAHRTGVKHQLKTDKWWCAALTIYAAAFLRTLNP